MKAADANKSRLVEDMDPESSESDSNDDMDAPMYDGNEANPFSPTDMKPYHMMDSKEKRRERNKILARKSRLKTKNELETLKVQLMMLMKENETLKRQMNTIEVPPASAKDLLGADFQLPDTIATLVKQLIMKEDKTITPRKLRKSSFCISNAISSNFPIVYASPGFLKLTGYELCEIIGRNCRFLHGPKTDREEVEKMRESLHKGEDITSVILNYRKDGKAFWNQVRLVHLKDQNNRTFLVVGIQMKVKPNLESGTLMASGSHHRQKGTGSSTSSSSSTTNSSSSLPTTHVLETAFPAISHREIDAFCSSVLSRERNHNSDYAPSTEYKGSQSRDLEASMEVDESRNESPMSNASDCMQDMFETGSVGAINANMLDDLFPSSMEMHSIMNDLKDKQLPTRLTSIIKSKPNPRKSSSIN